MTTIGKTHSLLTTRLASASLLFLLLCLFGGSWLPGGQAVAKGPRAGAQQEWLQKYYLTLPAPGSPYGVYTDAQAQAFAEEVFERTNTERVKKGHTALRRSSQLDAVAQAHAVHMAQARFFEHESPLGMEVFQRIEAAGCPDWDWAGENIAAGYRTPEIAVKEWMDSKGHRKNIRNEEYREIGIGVYFDAQADSRWYWVQVFATFDERGKATSNWLAPQGGSGSAVRSRFEAALGGGEAQAASEPRAVADSSARRSEQVEAEREASSGLELPVPPLDEPVLDLAAQDDGPDWEEAKPVPTN